jgi:ATP-binding cassette subfamily F protein uup
MTARWPPEMTLLTLKSIRKDFGIKEILRDASFSLEEGDKVGLIGTNGSGKSTLLKMIAGAEPIDGGEIWRNAGAKIVYLPQQPEIQGDRTVLEQVFADAGEQMALIREYEDISHRMERGDGDLDALMSQLSRVTEKIEAADAWDLETSAKVVLTKLGIQDFEARVGDLSGGYRKRIAIAAALLSNPDALLMDEPTNHLDAESVEWLQSYLNGFRGALLLITHDRYFLDRVTNRILEVDRGDLFGYAGNYSYYLEKKAEMEASTASSRQKHAGVLRRELEWLKRGPKARSTKQKARIQRIDDMQDREFKENLGKVDICHCWATHRQKSHRARGRVEGVWRSRADSRLHLHLQSSRSHWHHWPQWCRQVYVNEPDYRTRRAGSGSDRNW